MDIQSRSRRRAPEVLAMKGRASEIARYYDRMTIWYRLFYHPAGMHYGLWFPHTRTLGQAIWNHKQLVFRSLEPLAPESHLLDAGCGHGSTSLLFSELGGCRVTGMTLSSGQVDAARARARRAGREDRLAFLAGDFCDSGLAEGTFSHAFAVESLCHVPDPGSFLREMARVLRPGGRLVIADFFRDREEEAFTPVQRGLHARVLRGFMLPGLPAHGATLEQAWREGFEVIGDHDLTPGVLPTARRIRLRGLLALPFGYLLALLRLVPPELLPHLLACVHQPAAMRELGTYRLLVMDRKDTGGRPG